MAKRAALRPRLDAEEKTRAKTINALNLESTLKEDVPYTPTVRLKDRQDDQDPVAPGQPGVQDSTANRPWVDRRCKGDAKGSARDRGQSSGGHDDTSHNDLVLRAAQAVKKKEDKNKLTLEEKIDYVIKKEAQEKHDKKIAIILNEMEAEAIHLSEDLKAQDDDYNRMVHDRWWQRYREDAEWEKAHWNCRLEYWELLNQRRQAQANLDKEEESEWKRRKAELTVFKDEKVRRLNRELELLELEEQRKLERGYCPKDMTRDSYHDYKERQRDRIARDLKEGQRGRLPGGLIYESGTDEEGTHDFIIDETCGQPGQPAWRPVPKEQSEEKSVQWWGSSWTWTSSGWSSNGGWHDDQGVQEARTFTERGKSLTNKAKNEKTKMCTFYQQGRCDRGPACPFAHHKSELVASPDLEKTNKNAKDAAVAWNNDWTNPARGDGPFMWQTYDAEAWDDAMDTGASSSAQAAPRW